MHDAMTAPSSGSLRRYRTESNAFSSHRTTLLKQARPRINSTTDNVIVYGDKAKVACHRGLLHRGLQIDRPFASIHLPILFSCLKTTDSQTVLTSGCSFDFHVSAAREVFRSIVVGRYRVSVASLSGWR